MHVGHSKLSTSDVKLLGTQLVMLINVLLVGMSCVFHHRVGKRRSGYKTTKKQNNWTECRTRMRQL